MSEKGKIYLPPLTEKGLKDRIEKIIIDNKQGSLLDTINGNVRMKTVWELAIHLSFIVMGGTSKQRGSNSV